MGDTPLTFNFDTGTVDEFAAFIAALRARLTDSEMTVVDPGPDGIEHVVPRLCALPPGDPQILDVSLTGNGQTISIRLRRHDLYIMGYQDSTGTWSELPQGDGKRHLISNSSFLPFKETYGSVLGKARYESLPEVPFSLVQLRQAASDLASNNRNQIHLIARGVIRLAIAISEATRLIPITQFIQDLWLDAGTREDYLTADDDDLIHAWAQACSALQRFPRNQSFDFFALIPNIRAAVTILAILRLWVDQSNAGPSRPKRSIANTTALTTTYPTGQPLLEILSVRIIDIENKDSGELYGNISVTDSFGIGNIWERKLSDHIPIAKGEDVPLEGPSRPLYAGDMFLITVILWSFNQGTFSKSIASKKIEVDPFDYFTKYDVINTHSITGDYGSVLVNYIALSDALYAHIVVTLIKGGGESDPEVYGDIDAFNGHGSSTLFHKTPSQRTNINTGEHIGLLRTVVAVPTNHTLRIKALLWDHDPLSDDKIAEGYVDFKPLYNQSSEPQSIVGDSDGEIQVRVTWM